jgi:magnesium transporter
MDNEIKPLFRDVLDHAKRAEEDIDSLARSSPSCSKRA